MCGIVGGVTNTDITPLLLDGLKRLEYRGYDSSGLVLLTKNNKLTLKRAVGKVINLEKKLKINKIKNKLQTKEHNKKHHKKGIMRVRTYRVVSGAKAGWLVRTYGPMTWAQVDEFVADSESKAHADNGAKHLRPYIEERVGPMYWTPVEYLHDNPSTSDKPSKMTRVQLTHLNPGMSGEYYDLRQ